MTFPLFSLLLLIPTLVMAAPKAGDFFASGPPDSNKIALTFDDGPGPHTKKFLDLLDEYEAKATFFMLGDQVKYRPEVAREVAKRGHEIGNHTLRHTNYLKRLAEIKIEIEREVSRVTKPEEELKQELLLDLQESQSIIEKATGVTPKILRMPHGIDRPWVNDVAKAANYVIVNWSYGADWTKESMEKLAQDYVKAIEPGAILLFHDGGGRRKRSLALMEAVLKAAQAKNMEIVPVGALVGLK